MCIGLSQVQWLNICCIVQISLLLHIVFCLVGALNVVGTLHSWAHTFVLLFENLKTHRFCCIAQLWREHPLLSSYRAKFLTPRLWGLVWRSYRFRKCGVGASVGGTQFGRSRSHIQIFVNSVKAKLSNLIFCSHYMSRWYGVNHFADITILIILILLKDSRY